MKRMMDDLELRNKKMKVMVDSVPTCTIPRTILQDYKDQKPLDYEFLCCDGSIHISELALRHSDFYNDMCKGMKPEVEWGKWISKYMHTRITQTVPPKQNLNRKAFNYDLYPKNVVKILTDSLHGLPVLIKTKTEAIQFITLLGCDEGALIPNRKNNQTQIKASELELKLYCRCKNFLFRTSDVNDPQPELTEIGLAACLFYFLSFEKPDFSEIIFEISKRTNLNACHAVFVNWSISESFSYPDDEIAGFIKHTRDEQLLPSTTLRLAEDWTHTQMKRIRKIYNDIHQMTISDHAKFDEIDKLVNKFITY